MMKVLFYFFAAAIFYTYAGYPILLLWAAKMFRKKIKKGSLEPSVSVILSVFNEERGIERKLLNILEMDYPFEKLEVLVGSDAAKDLTDDIVSRFSSNRIRFFRFVENLGKPHVLNELVKEAKGSILIFTDARQTLDPRAFRALVRNFYDPSVGAVSGELLFQNSAGGRGVSQGMNAYWNYEKFLRKSEGNLGYLLGATGALYAIRRYLFSPLPQDILVDDMFIPFSVIQKGYCVIFESEARVFDQPSRKGGEEFKRKVRTLAGNYQIFQYFPQLFIPLKSPIAWQLFSHKFLRLLVPFFLAGILITNLFLIHEWAFGFLFWTQVIFYLFAILEFCREWIPFTLRLGIFQRLGSMAYTFCLLNYSAMVGLVNFLTKKYRAAWEKAYA